MNQKDETILKKIIKYCLEIKETHHHFKQDKKLFVDEKCGFIYRNSVTMPILQIGELAKMLSEEFLNEYVEIPWKLIMRMRDIVAHHYGSIDYEIVWNTSVSDIPQLYMRIEKILNREVGEEEIKG